MRNLWDSMKASGMAFVERKQRAKNISMVKLTDEFLLNAEMRWIEYRNECIRKYDNLIYPSLQPWCEN